MRWGLPLRGKEVQVQSQACFENAGDRDPLEEIKKRRRNVFLASNKDIILPLLPDEHLDSMEARGGRIKPYKLVQQPPR